MPKPLRKTYLDKKPRLLRQRRKTTRVTDPRGFIREYEYDTNGLMTKLTEPDNAILQFENSDDGLRFKKYDGLGFATTYSYRSDRTFSGVSDTSGNVTLEKDPLTYTLEYDYGLYDQVTRTKDKNGNVRTMAYYSATNPATDAVKGKLQSVTLGTLNGTANVLLQSYTYYPDGNIKQLTEYLDPATPTRKRITTYTYDSNGLNLLSVTVSGSGKTTVTSYTYDTLGRRKTATLTRRTSNSDPTMIALTTTYDYDNLDRVTKITDVLGNYMETTYDGNGKIYQIKGNYKKPDTTFDTRIISTRTYDAADRLITDTDTYGNITSYAYDEAGNLLTTTDANGHIMRYEYDAMNRRTAAIDANGNRAETVYDLAGHPIKVVNALGKSVTTIYDANGRPTTITDPLGYQTTFGYDANGNVKTITDANAVAGLQAKNSYNATIYKEYDELNRVKREVDALNGETKYSYDLLGNITSITDAENHVTTFIYNDLGQLTEVRDPLIETPTDKVTSFTYDEAGNVLTRTKRSGTQSIYTYDLLNRLTQAQHGSITETITYDIYGNKQSVSNPDVTYSYVYDLKNRPTKKTDSRVNKFLAYTYGKAGEALTKTNYDGSTTEYRYDSANKLVAQRNQDYLEVSYQYDGAGRLLSRILSNGAKTQYNWDDGNRLTSLVNRSADGTTVNSTSYQRDRIGNITSQTDSTGTTNFQYDALYRLTSADYPNTTSDQSYTYDKVGNRKTMTKAGITTAYVYNADNRLTEIRQGSETGAIQNSFDYDADGNTTAKRNSAGTVVQSFTYDAKGRVTSVGSNTFAYDPYDYRIAKSDSQGSKTYLLEGEHLEAVMSGSQWQAKYLRGAVIDEIVNGYQFDTNGTWTNYTYHHDTLQSVIGLTGHEGSVLQATGYNPFGDKQWTAGAVNNNRIGYTGREEDQDSGLMYYRARYYDPAIGRFISEDPKGFGAGVNFYAYVLNNPVNANDPMGLDGISSFLSWGSHIMNTVAIAFPEVPIVKVAGVAFSVASGVYAYYQYKHKEITPINFKLTMGQSAGDLVAGIGGKALLGNVGEKVAVFLLRETNTVLAAKDTAETISNAFEPKALSDSVVDTVIPTPSAPRNFISTTPATNTIQENIFSEIDSGHAAGGFVIYPNKSNLNMMRHVYTK
ncbi:MAG: RHS repeat-associated core domain-containing protein [Saprospiraceae bacterium]|nr:RHS repeat-associated core domain-containing protein [Saprospiraceae bacterium]